MEGDNERKIYILLDISGVLIRDGKANQELINYLTSRKEVFSYTLLTNLGGDIEKVLLEQYGIPKFYEECITAGEAGYAKPHPEIFAMALERIGAKSEECVFVDDSEENVESVRLLGMQGIVYRNFESFQHDFEILLH